MFSLGSALFSCRPLLLPMPPLVLISPSILAFQMLYPRPQYIQAPGVPVSRLCPDGPRERCLNKGWPLNADYLVGLIMLHNLLFQLHFARHGVANTFLKHAKTDLKGRRVACCFGPL